MEFQITRVFIFVSMGAWPDCPTDSNSVQRRLVICCGLQTVAIRTVLQTLASLAKWCRLYDSVKKETEKLHTPHLKVNDCEWIHQVNDMKCAIIKKKLFCLCQCRSVYRWECECVMNPAHKVLVCIIVHSVDNWRRSALHYWSLL